MYLDELVSARKETWMAVKLLWGAGVNGGTVTGLYN